MLFAEPMLAYKVRDEEELESLPYPLLVSLKYDGVRGFGYNGKIYSRKLKEFPNRKLQAWAKEYGDVLQWVDGEIIVGQPHGELVMNRAQSFTSSFDSTEDFTFYVFDFMGDHNLSTIERMKVAKLRAEQIPNAVFVNQCLVNGTDDVIAFEEKCLEAGYEGIILRRPDSPYRNGRPGKRQLFMMKFKRWVDDEATIIGFEEQLHNANEAQTNELGRMKRQSLQENMIPKGTLGAFVCSSPKWSETFNVGNGEGMTDSLRQSIWSKREEYLGKKITFRYFPIGVKDRPRFPQWRAFRSDI